MCFGPPLLHVGEGILTPHMTPRYNTIGWLSQWDKLIADILSQNPNLRFETLYKALIKIGYTASQPGGEQSLYLSEGGLYAHHAPQASATQPGLS